MEHSGVTTYRNHRDTAGTAQMGNTGLEWERASTPGKCFTWGCLKQKSPSISRKPRAKPCCSSRVSCAFGSCPRPGGTQPPSATSEERTELAGRDTCPALPRWAPPHLEKQLVQGHLQPLCPEITTLVHSTGPKSWQEALRLLHKAEVAAPGLHPYLPCSDGQNVFSPPWD